MRKLIGKKSNTVKEGDSMALWGSSVRSRSRPPLLKLPQNVNRLEIPEDWEVLPAARMTETGPTVHRVLQRKSAKKFEQSLNAQKRRSRSA